MKLGIHLSLERAILQQKWRFFDALRHSDFSASQLVSAHEFRRMIRPRRSDQIAHILGSGGSILTSIQKINPSRDFIIGFNFAPLLRVPIDVYLAEVASKEHEILSEGLKSCLHENPASEILFKNLWQGRLSSRYIEANFKIPSKLLCDILLPVDLSCSSPKSEQIVGEKLLEPDPIFAFQKTSTIFLLIAQSLLAGYKKVVVHGLDFGGPHFYKLPQFDGWPQEFPEQCRDLLLSKSPEPGKSYGRMNQSFGFLKEIKEKVEGSQKLLSGAAESPSAEILDIDS